MQLLEWTVTPLGSVVVARTCPLPAETDAETPPFPLLERETVQPPELPVTIVLLAPPELLTPTELLTCACANEVPMPNTRATAVLRIRKITS